VTAQRKHILIFIFVGILAIASSLPRGSAQTTNNDNGSDVLAHLNAAINWYKNLAAKVAAGTEPSDSIYSNNAETYGAEVVRLAFQSARAQMQLDAKPSAPGNAGANGDSNNNGTGSVQKYAQMENDVSQRIADDESQIAALKQRHTGVKNVLAQEQSFEGKLALDKATLDAVQQMKSFVEGSNSGGSGLKGSIDELARAVPEVLEPPANNAASNKVNATAASTKTTATARSGLVGQLMTLYEEMQSIRSIELRMDEAANIEKIANNLRVPLRRELTDTLQKEKDLGAQKGVTREQYDALTQRFKGISAALLPLSEEIVVLDQSQSNFVQWTKAHTTESRSILISIGTRVAFILAAIGLVFGLAEVWRRLTFRYIHELRRRRQFLLLRRFVMGFLIFLVIVLGFASEFSSLATFAGFVTAGIAVGLQTILLSVAAYFFVIGRYGISVGDRISVAGVTGDVIDVGLVRFYVMEYAATGADLFPTGRIVVFSNAVLFQATTPLFKQLPGTRYTWHEAVLPIAPKADYGVVQQALDAAVSPVYKEYSLDTLWHRGTFDGMDLTVKPPAPEHRVQLAETGPEMVVRYPVDLNRSAEIDDKITRTLMNAIHTDEKLASAVSGSPKIRPTVKS
jgi:small-conductance mechanosensitive channel